MRIAYLSTFYPFRGGIRQFNENLLFAFMEQGHEVKAFTFSRQYPSILFPGTSQYSKDEKDPSRLQAAQVLDSINPFSWRLTAKAIEAWGPDVIITKFWLPFFGPSLGYVVGYLKKKGVAAISILDNVRPHERRFGDITFTKYFLKRNSGFLVMSSTVEKDLVSLHPKAIYHRRTHPLYTNFPKAIPKIEAREQLGIKSSTPTLLYFGFIRSYKGIDDLLTAFSHLADFQLIIAGEPYVDWTPYQKQIESLPNKENILVWNRFIQTEEIPLLFSASDLLVLPYKHATQSGVLAMSAYYDLPVIATDVGSLRENIEELGIGSTVSPEDPIKLKEGILHMMENGRIDYYRKQVGIKKQEHTWKNFSKEILRLIEKLRSE